MCDDCIKYLKTRLVPGPDGRTGRAHKARNKLSLATITMSLLARFLPEYAAARSKAYVERKNNALQVKSPAAGDAREG